MEFKDYYRVLDVTRNANDNQVTETYWQLARNYRQYWQVGGRPLDFSRWTKGGQTSSVDANDLFRQGGSSNFFRLETAVTVCLPADPVCYWQPAHCNKRKNKGAAGPRPWPRLYQQQGTEYE